MLSKMSFPKASEAAVAIADHHLSLLGAVTVILLSCGAGAFLGLPSQWHLLSIMLGTLITLFILILIQHSQNKDLHALHVKSTSLFGRAVPEITL